MWVIRVCSCGLLLLLLLDASQQAAVELLAAALALLCGVGELTAKGRAELHSGGEVRTRLANGLEGAVEFDWAGAVTVSEHPVMLFSEPAHVRPLGLGRKQCLVVEGLDFLAHGEILV